MFKNKVAILAAVAGTLANAGLALAEGAEWKAPLLTLDAATLPAEGEAAPAAGSAGPLMMGLEKVGVAGPVERAGVAIYGWMDAGYTYDHRDQGHHGPVIQGPIPYDNRLGQPNHVMLDQVALRFERTVSTDKFDVGGLVEVMYGSDAAAIHAHGLSFGNGGADDRFNPQYQFDIPQAYVDVNVPVGNGLRLRAGKFYGLLGYESNDPRSTPFYSRSYLFNATPYTMTGVMAWYGLNDQWEVGSSIIRGSDQALEDNNGGISYVGHVVWKPNKQWSLTLNCQVGPEDAHDTSHYRTAPDVVVTWQATEKFSLGLEVLYMYDGGRNTSVPGVTHAYGDVWGAALYGQYVFNEYVTGNVRVEAYHDFVNSFDVANPVGLGVPAVNVYEATLGVSIKPFPKDAVWKNLVVRPETRYDTSEDHVFQAQGRSFRDQWTIAADVIFSF